MNWSELKIEKVKRLYQRVKTVKDNHEVEAGYMTMLVYEKEIAMEAREEGLKEGHVVGETKKSITIIREMFQKGYEVTATADIMEEEISYIEKVYDLIQNNLEYTDLEIAETILSNNKYWY